MARFLFQTTERTQMALVKFTPMAIRRKQIDIVLWKWPIVTIKTIQIQKVKCVIYNEKRANKINSNI